MHGAAKRPGPLDVAEGCHLATRFDSPSVFGALLDETAGSWRISPAGPARAERRYVDGTNVLETVFTTPSGSLRLTDLMPVTPLCYAGARRASSTSRVRSSCSLRSSPTGCGCGFMNRFTPPWNRASCALVRARASASGGGS